MTDETNPILPAALAREAKTVETMIGIYCAGNHGSRRADREAALCEECAALVNYVRERLAKCPHSAPARSSGVSASGAAGREKGHRKPKCSKCEIHCYREPERTTIRKVMAYAGPRMAIRHPIQTVKHMLASRAKK
jgi:hypothetical protein